MANNGKAENKVCLIVIDGWGVTSEEYGNAILAAHTPVMDKLCSGNHTAFYITDVFQEIGHRLKLMVCTLAFQKVLWVIPK